MRSPLRYRLANPPSVFLGRESEEDALRAALARGPVAVVSGAAGLGKSALVQHALRDADPVHVLRGRPGLSFGGLGRELLRALGGDAPEKQNQQEQGGEDEDEELLERVLHAAESVSRVIILEDLHLLEEPVVTRWLVALTSYARASRWVLVTRSRPEHAGLQEQVVTLCALHPEAARALAEACAPPCPAQELDALVAAAGGSPQRVRELAAAVAPQPRPARTPAKFRELEGVLQGGLQQSAASTPDRLRSLGVRATVIAGVRLISEGRGARGRQVLRALQQHAELPSGLGLLAGVAQGLLRITGGRYTGLTLVSRELLREAEHLGQATLYHWAFMLERLVSLSASVSTPEPPWAPAIPLPQGISARYLSAVRVAHRARLGEVIPDAHLPRVEPGDGPLARCVCEFLEVHVCLLRGDLEQAEVLAATLVRRCVELRVLVVKGEALLMLCYAQLALGRVDELRRSADELARVARSARSRRYTVIADLLRTALAPQPDVLRLLKIAEHGDASPTAARVAAALLGGSPADDALDRLLLEGLASRWESQVQALSHGEAASWVFDPGTGLVFVGRRVEQATPLALGVLSCLFDAAASSDGFAGIETIARVVWEVDDYHPLRDAKRVHVAIRRLRMLIEDDPSSPARLITVEGGYTLARGALPGRLAPVA